VSCKHAAVIESDTNDEELCQEKLKRELAKPAAQRNRPRLKKLFRATFTLRRNVVIAAEDGAVQTLVKDFSLLSDMEFVSTQLKAMYNISPVLQVP